MIKIIATMTPLKNPISVMFSLFTGISFKSNPDSATIYQKEKRVMITLNNDPYLQK